MIAATKNTYPVKECLKSCGATWNSDKNVWDCSIFDSDRWENKMKNPTWNGRKLAKLCESVVFEEV